MFSLWEGYTKGFIMTKTEREEWEWYINILHIKEKAGEDLNLRENNILAADVYIRKLERELQALKHKKAVAAILQKKV